MFSTHTKTARRRTATTGDLKMQKTLGLGDLKQGQMARILSVQTQSAQSLAELAGLGVLPDRIVRMVDNHRHHVIFKIDYKKIAADKEVAAGIAVQVLG